MRQSEEQGPGLKYNEDRGQDRSLSIAKARWKSKQKC